MPGMPTSRIKQFVVPTYSEARNSSADENDRAEKSNSLSKSGNDSRTDSSSSTTDTNELGIILGSSSCIRCACDPGNVSRARAIVERDLKEMQTSVVPEAILNQAKVELLQQIPLSESSVGSIAEGLISRTSDGLPPDEPTLAARMYVKLTPHEVQAAF